MSNALVQPASEFEKTEEVRYVTKLSNWDIYRMSEHVSIQPTTAK
jgi:hypothetical protein